MSHFEWREAEEFGERYGFARLDNGFEIYLIPKERSEAYALLRVGIGSGNTVYYRNGHLHRVPPGTAHFIEHKLFANEDGSDAMNRLAELGASANAYTALDCTCYLFSCRKSFSDSLRELLKFVSEPYFTQENVESEAEIIRQESAMYEDMPLHRLHYRMLHQLYPKHPIHNNICGTASEIGKISPQILHRVYRAFYRPSNMKLFLSGNIDPEEILRVTEAFGTPTQGDCILPDPPADEIPPTPKRSILRAQISRPAFALGIKHTAQTADVYENTRRFISFEILLQWMLGPTSELNERLYQSGYLTSDLRFACEEAPGCTFTAVKGESDRPYKVLAEMKASIAECVRRGIPEEDFLRLRRSGYSDFLSSLDGTESLAEAFASNCSVGIEYFTYGRMLRDAKYEDAVRYLSQSFLPEQMTETICIPLPGKADSDKESI